MLTEGGELFGAQGLGGDPGGGDVVQHLPRHLRRVGRCAAKGVAEHHPPRRPERAQGLGRRATHVPGLVGKTVADPPGERRAGGLRGEVEVIVRAVADA